MTDGFKRTPIGVLPRPCNRRFRIYRNVDAHVDWLAAEKSSALPEPAGEIANSRRRIVPSPHKVPRRGAETSQVLADSPKHRLLAASQYRKQPLCVPRQ